jgi:hypothetical protein
MKQNRETSLRMTPGRRQGLMVLTVIVWTLAILGSFMRRQFAAKSSVTVNLETHPLHVKVAINGQKYAEGAYVETPLLLSLAPGKSRIRISREGYIPHVVTVDGLAGAEYKMDDVVLQKSPEANFKRLAINVQPPQRVLFVEIDDGVVRGETPLVVDDLVPTKPHSLTVYPAWPAKEPAVRCQLPVPLAALNGESHSVRVKVKSSGSLSFIGCKREHSGR